MPNGEQKRLDRPDREKIAEALYLRYGISAISPSSGFLLKWEILGEDSKKEWREDADQIIALFPDIEEAKREERERITNKLLGMFAYPKMVIPMNTEILIQVLKGD